MELIPIFLKELEEEAAITRKMLAIVPNDKYDWAPHPKSMTIRKLTTHIGEIPGWIAISLTTDQLDFTKDHYEPSPVNNTEELLALLEKSVADSTAELNKANESELDKMWTMRAGDHIISTRSKAEVLRMSLNQLVHHRAQLGVFLRLLDVPVPGSYGPSADDTKY